MVAGDQDSPGILHFVIRHERQKSWPREFLDARTGVGMTKHTLRRENDERLPPGAPRLAPQHVEILRRRRGLADLHVVFGGELHVALEPCAGMLRSLAFEAIRQ